MREMYLKVEGMMCEGCENRIKNSLKNLEGIEEVIANHNENSVKVTLKEDIDESNIKKIIEELGFEIIE